MRPNGTGRSSAGEGDAEVHRDDAARHSDRHCGASHHRPLVLSRSGIRNRIERAISQIDVSYPRSPLHVGPGSGDRAPDGWVRDRDGEEIRLFDLLREPRYALLDSPTVRRRPWLSFGPGASGGSSRTSGCSMVPATPEAWPATPGGRRRTGSLAIRALRWWLRTLFGRMATSRSAAIGMTPEFASSWTVGCTRAASDVLVRLRRRRLTGAVLLTRHGSND
jgi:hypothetical protein